MAYDIPSISDLEAIQLLNKHYAEVITSKEGGVSSAADITQTTNPITGVVRRTLYKILDDAQIEHDAQITAHEVEHDAQIAAHEIEHDAQITAHEVEHDAQIAAHEIEHDAQITAHEVEHDNQMQSFENDFDSRLAGMAFTRVGTFTAGATLTDMRQTLLWEVSQGGDGHEYGWTGSFLPSGKVVAAGSTPATSGGVGAGSWVDRTDDSLRDELEPRIEASEKNIEDLEERLLGVGAKIYRGSNGQYVQNGDVVPAETTHLRVLLNGKPENVAMSPIASGLVTNLTETGATIGGAFVTFINAVNGYKGEWYAGAPVEIGDTWWHQGSEWRSLTGADVEPTEGNDWRSLDNHANLTNRDDSGAHPASAIVTTQGDTVQKRFDSTSREYESVSDMVSDLSLSIGDRCVVWDYYGGDNPNFSGVMFFEVVPDGAGVVDGGKYIQGIGCQFKQHLKSKVDIKSFGARGDRSEDATTAIQSAINYVSLAPESAYNPVRPHGLCVYVSYGIYAVTDGLKVTNSNVVIEGDGMFSSIIEYDNVNGVLTTDDYILNVGVSPSGTNSIRGVILRDFSIRGDRITAGQNYPRGVTMLDTHHWVWERFSVYGTHQAFKLLLCWIGSIKECSFEWNYRGSELYAECHNIEVVRTVFGGTKIESSDRATSSQLRVRASWGVKFDTCDFEFANAGNMVTCLLLENDCRATTVIGTYFESYNNYAIYIRDDPTGCSGGVIQGNMFNATYQGSTGKGVFFRADLDNHSGWLITGNDVRIANEEYFVTSPSGRPKNLNVFGNSIITGAGEMEPWLNKVTRANQMIKTLDSSYKAYAATPTFIQNDVRIEDTSTYLVTVAQEFSLNTGDQGVYLVSRIGTQINIAPIVPLASGSVTAELVGGHYYMRHTKSAGQGAALRITTINISQR